MAMVSITPVEVHVQCDLFDGQPRQIRMATETVPVVAVDRVRDESAAYPVGGGPRTLFEVITPDGRLALSFWHRERSWSVDALDPDRGPPALPA